MMISTRGRYALRVMLDLAERGDGEYVSLKEIAERQEISRKYLESIMTTLSKAHLVDSSSGKTGGYRLVKEPEKYRVGDILRAVEGDMAPVACLCDTEPKCTRSDRCFTLPFWKGLADVIDEYLDRHTLAELVTEGHMSREHCCGRQ